MKNPATLVFLSFLLAGAAAAQCGNTINWTDASCQVISGAQQLTTAIVNGVNDPRAWTVVSRHGEYAQNETECNVPSALSLANSNLTVTTTVSAYACGNFDPTTGNISTTPASWPYSTGDIQWNTFNFTYGTVIVRARFPSQNTGLWPAIWFLGSNCQNANKYTGDTGTGGCPNVGQTGYREIDMLEFYGPSPNPWPQANVIYPSGLGTSTYRQSPINDGNFHVYTMSWLPSTLSFFVDGSPGPVYNGSQWIPNLPLFLIMQIQTANAPGPPNNANLPASMSVDYVKVCNTNYTAAQCTAAASNDANVIFYDDFTSSGLVLTLG